MRMGLNPTLTVRKDNQPTPLNPNCQQSHIQRNAEWKFYNCITRSFGLQSTPWWGRWHFRWWYWPEDELDDANASTMEIKDSLIINLFDGNLENMGLMRRLKKKRNIKAELLLTYFGCKYFIARSLMLRITIMVTNVAYYNYVLTQEPLLLDDHYLTIKKWILNFIPNESQIIKILITTWVL